MSSGEPDPFDLFNDWFALAEANEPSDVDAASIATVDASGQPSLRVVLIREASREGFKFYTNLGSRKAQELAINPKMALCFHWKSLAKQIRIEGQAELVSDAVADAYFAGRPRESQIGAWASQQSQTLENRAELEAEFRKFEQKFGSDPVSRPPFWSGYLLVPTAFEFWDKRDHRLHHRQRFQLHLGKWEQELLYP